MVTNIKSYIRTATQTNLKKNLPEIIVKVKYERRRFIEKLYVFCNLKYYKERI